MCNIILYDYNEIFSGLFNNYFSDISGNSSLDKIELNIISRLMISEVNMAQYILSPSYLGDNDGENCIKSLLDKLNDDYLVWFDIEVDKKHPDFTVIGKEVGIQVIEVKGWLKDQIIEFGDKEVKLKINGVRSTRTSPIVQSWDQVCKVRNRLAQVMSKTNKFPNIEKKLVFNNIIAFPNMYRSEFEELIDDNLDLRVNYKKKDNFIFKDEIDECTDQHSVLKTLLRASEIKPTYKQYLNHNELEYAKKWADSKLYIDSNNTDNHISLLSKKQGETVRSYPDRNILIRGVAGSGKSVLVTKRAEFLAQRSLLHYNNDNTEHELKKVLLLTANASYYSYVKKLLKSKLDTLHNLHIGLMSSIDDSNMKYDYILVDEAQDFKDDDMKIIGNLLKDSGHITIAADGAQNVYEQNIDFNSYGFNFDEDDIYFLDHNYRNTDEIALFSNQYLLDEEIPITRELGITKTNFLVHTNKRELKGKIPTIDGLDTLGAEARHIRCKVDQILEDGYRSNEICIVLFSLKEGNGYKDTLVDLLKKNFKHRSLNILDNFESKMSFNPEADSILVTTPQSVKGLEYKHVIVSLSLPFHYANEKEKKKVYVALTRATKTLTITYSREKSKHVSILCRIRSTLIDESSRESLINEVNQQIHDTDLIKTTYENSISELVNQNRLLQLTIDSAKENHENSVLEIKEKLARKTEEYNGTLYEIKTLKEEFDEYKKSLQNKKKGEKSPKVIEQETRLKEDSTIIKGNKASLEKIIKKLKIKLRLSYLIVSIMILLTANNYIGLDESFAWLKEKTLILENNDEAVNEYIEHDNKMKFNFKVSVPQGKNGKGSYIESVSSNLSEIFPDGNYLEGTEISYYSQGDKEYLRVKGEKKEEVSITQIEFTQLLNQNEEYGFTFCNYYVDVEDEVNKYENILDVYESNEYININENEKFVIKIMTKNNVFMINK